MARLCMTSEGHCVVLDFVFSCAPFWAAVGGQNDGAQKRPTKCCRSTRGRTDQSGRDAFIFLPLHKLPAMTHEVGR